MNSHFARFFPFLSWKLSGASVRTDLIAGITVALVLIPQSMAYAQLAGLPAYYGLYAAFLPGIIAAMWGSSAQLATGPVAVASLLTASALAPLAATGSEQFVALAILLALMIGLIQLGLGIFKLGVVVNFLSHPVIVGFTNAAAITDKFPADHSNQLGGEIYFSSGSWMFGTEFYMHQFSTPAAIGNPVFPGGEVVAMYIITGESRPYSTVSGIYGFVPVNKSVFDGGPGAWEVVLRYSTLDLDDGTVTGGKLCRITPMINWYLSQNVRFELAYGYGVLNRFNLEGVTQFFQSRIQFML